MPPKGHALLSASSSDRWLHCPPSARLCELYEDKGSDYAAEGTDAHVLCEYKLRKALGMEAPDPTENLTWFNQEMDDCAAGYAAYILELLEAAKETCADPVVLIEQRVDFSRWVEDGFGTSDVNFANGGGGYMPKRPKRPCSYPGCPNLTDKRFCPEHEKLEAQRYERYDRDPDTKRRYGRAWKRIRDSYPCSPA